jgi:hypothetical protein
MKRISLSFLLVSLLPIWLFAVALPYSGLSNELYGAKSSLQSLSDMEVFKKIINHYSAACENVNSDGMAIMSDGLLDKDETAAYLKSLRELEATYESSLYVIQTYLRDAIQHNDYASFTRLIDADLPRMFDNTSLSNETIAYYRQHKHAPNAIIERQITLIEAQRRAKEEAAAQQAAYEAAVLSTSATPQNLSSGTTTPSSNTINNAGSLHTSYLDSSLRGKRDAAMTPWMSRKTYQDQFDNGYYKKKNLYPAYIETDTNGNRRVLQLPYVPKFYLVAKSGRTFESFNKIYTQQRLYGKKLLSLHINRINGLDIYSGIWVSEEVYDREAAKLQAYGIGSVE